MESNQDMEMIKQAIHKLIEENRIEDTSSSDVKLSEDDEQLLSILLSQLESLKESKRSNLRKEETSVTIDKPKPITRSGNEEESGETENGLVDEDIVKELEAVKRQNTITHCLVSTLIVVTLIWQLFEVSLIHKLQNGLTHPFRSFGSLLAGMLPGRTAGNNDTNDGDSGTNNDNNDHRNGEEQ
ncbi:hypothetical protein V6N13_101630 [Hibiscus sabdariffa]|uniref:Uncharacterized protein n=1 Tax=Hibiscus sabdariffa TaxID=183260 RepID=A0ABR2QLY4_9ROSI